MNEYILEYDAFIRSIKQNKDTEHSILLGAGASIESGILSAEDCIWEWKKDIFLTKNPQFIQQYKNTKSDTERKAIQQWLDSQGVYPKLKDDNEYSFYAEKAHPIEGDRQKFFEQLSIGKEPSLGYHLLCIMAEKKIIRSVWTTNFDGLIIKAAHKNNINPIEITLDTSDRIYRSSSTKELLCIALHGDYKYGPMKNTSKELDNQNNIFTEALKHELKTRNLIVLGYSGRDKSLMSVLKQAYSEQGGGRLYWCGYGDVIHQPVQELIDIALKSGREAYYVATDGFDKTILNNSMACFQDSNEDLSRIEEIKNKFSKNDYLCSSFSIEKGSTHKIIKSNLVPVGLPKACFQFEVNIKENREIWDKCKKLIEDVSLTAVPYKGMVYAFGTKDLLFQYFKDILISDIVQTPITRQNVFEVSVFQELILKTITKAFSIITKLPCNKYDKIWDESKKKKISVNKQSYQVFEAVQLSLFFDAKYCYLSLNPSFYLPEEIKLERYDYQELARQYYLNLYQRKANLNYDQYIAKWKKILLNENGIKIEFPINSGSGFYFTIRANNLFIGITQQNKNFPDLKVPSSFNKEQIVHNGIEYVDPQLSFFNPINRQPINNFHPMQGLIKNQPFDYFMNDIVYKPKIDLGIICSSEYSDIFYAFLNRLNQKIKAEHNPDYLISYPGFINVYGIPINIPVKNSDNWLDCELPTNIAPKNIVHELARIITQKIEKLENNSVIVIFIPAKWEDFTSYSDEIEKFDLHDYIKAFAAQKSISTQLIREQTINSDLLCQIIWWLSLAFYVKSLRTPWILTNLDNQTAFAGLGYSISHKENNKKILLGCSHIYTADGQGLKYKLARINDFHVDRRNNPFLSEHEAYQLGINIRELFYKSVGDLPKRVVIHKRTRFTKEEIKGLVQSIKHSGIENLDLIEINHEENARFIALDKSFNTDSFPVSRGCCFPISENTAYLFTHGIAPSVKNPNHRYFMGGTSIPVPLKLKKHYGNGDLGTIATEILGLSKMNWNSFDLYTKLPCTIQSSAEIARIGWLLSHYEGRTYDYRYLM